MFSSLALGAMIAEAVAGYPDALFRRIGHPVTWMGRLIAWLDRHWNCAAHSPAWRRLSGCAALALLVALSLAAGYALQQIFFSLFGPALGLLASVLAGSSLIACRSLDR